MRIPSNEYCEELFDRYAVPAPIRRHSEVVESVGRFLAESLDAADVPIDVELVTVGCKVHDAFKAASLEQLEPRPEWNYAPSARELQVWRELRARYAGMHETLVAAEMFRPDFPEFADFVAKIGSTGNPTYLSERLELKVLHYADWRVQFDQLIGFDERLAYLRDAYKGQWIDKGASWWEETLAAEKDLEAEIFGPLDFSPDELRSVMVRASVLPAVA
jgi:hypothetical protein